MPDVETIASRLRRYRWRTVAAGGGILVVWLLASAVVPRCTAALAHWQEWQAQQRRLATVVAWEVEQTNLEARRLHLLHSFGTLYVSLPKSDQISVILQALQEYAAATSVRLNQVRQGDRVDHAAYDELPVGIELQGTFHGVGRFVDQVERSPYVMKVRSLEVESPPALLPEVRTKLALRVIILKEKQQP